MTQETCVIKPGKDTFLDFQTGDARTVLKGPEYSLKEKTKAVKLKGPSDGAFFFDYTLCLKSAIVYLEKY